jgi:hypothetical protein
VKLDCGDSLCEFATDKSGQRTNGGCRCWPRVPGEEHYKITAIKVVFAEMGAKIRTQEEQLKDMKALVIFLANAYEQASEWRNQVASADDPKLVAIMEFPVIQGLKNGMDITAISKLLPGDGKVSRAITFLLDKK